MAAHKDRLIAAADILGMDPAELLAKLDPSRAWGWQGTPPDPETDEPRDKGPAPEGFACFAHWSTAHNGINVEIDAPEGLPLTVHVNDWRAVNVVIGTDDPADPDDEPFPLYGPEVLDDDGTHAVACVCEQCAADPADEWQRAPGAEPTHPPIGDCDGGPSCPWHRDRTHADEGIDVGDDDDERAPGEHAAGCTRTGVYGHPGACV